MRMNLHALADYRALELHWVIAARVRTNPELVARARAKLDAMYKRGVLCSAHRDAWAVLLDGDRDALASAMLEESDRGQELRQVTPFTFVVGARERWLLWKSARAAWMERAARQ
jgi:hypothetical protein